MRFASMLLVAFGMPQPAGQGRQADDAAEAEGHSVRVEIRGQLLPGGGDAGPLAEPLIKAGDLSFILQFRDPPPDADSLKAMQNRTVVVRGVLVRRPDRDRLVCVVEGGVREAAEMAQYLVGYSEQGPAAAEALCKRLGLRVVDRYQPGRFLVVEPTGETADDFLGRLRQDPAVRYVEQNAEVRIPERPDAGPSIPPR